MPSPVSARRLWGTVLVTLLGAAASFGAGCGTDQNGLLGTDDASVGDSGLVGDDVGTGADATMPTDSGNGGDAQHLPDAKHDGPSGSDSGGIDASKDATTDSSPVDTGGPDAPDAPPDVPTPCLGMTTSCGAPGNCVDCTSSPAGSDCIAEVCGCMSQGDCPTGNACNGSNVCTTACTGGLTCNGGCCGGNTCQPGTGNGACAVGGPTCQACSGSSPTCDNGSCTAECGQAGNGTCGTGFCCDSQDRCTDDTAPATCGKSGQTCVDCTGAPQGTACLNGACGCTGAADCAGSPRGQSCLGSGACGCFGAGNCPADKACNNFQCTSSCNALSLCNGGCCSAGTCVATCPSPQTCPLGTCI